MGEMMIDIYNKDKLNDWVDEDEIDGKDEGFMQGYLSDI